MSRLTTDVQEFKSSFKLVISQVSAPGSPHPLRRTRAPHPKPGEGVGEGPGKLTEGRRRGSVQGRDKLFLSCWEILPPRQRSQGLRRAFPGPACLAPRTPGTRTALRRMGEDFTDVHSLSSLLAPWLLGHGIHTESFCSVSRVEREANWDLSGRLRAHRRAHPAP